MNKSKDRQLLSILPIFFVCAAATLCIKSWIINPVAAGIEEDYLLKVAIIFFVGLLGWRVHYPNAPAFSFIYRAVLSVFLLYLVTAYPSATASTYAYKTLSQYILWIEPLVIIAGFIALWKKPVLGAIPILYYIEKRFAVCHILGIPVDRTDWDVLADVGIFLLTGYVVYILYLFGIKFLKEKPAFSKKNYLALFVLFSTAIHLSNYFYSGMFKLFIGNTLFDWVLYNHTPNLIIGFHDIGTHLILLTDDIVLWAYNFFGPLTVPLNAMILIAQLMSIGIMAWRYGTRLLVLFYDVTHVMIFVLTGIFFWKWIILNMAYCHCLAKIPKGWFKIKYMCVMAFIILISPLFFSVAFLAWFDTNNVNTEIFYAVTEDGEKVRIPNAYFLDFALTLNQTKLAGPHPAHFQNVHINVTARTIENMRESNACKEKIEDINSNKPLLSDHLVQVIKNHHKYVLTRLDDNGQFNYSFYPHHKFSNPIQFSDFSNVDIRKIKAYEFVIESSCLQEKDNTIQKNVVSRSSQLIPVE